MTYAGGYTGSVGREEAFAFIRDQMMASRPSLSQSMFRVQRDITNAMRYPLDAMGIFLNKQSFMYKVLAPCIITPYKFLWTYGSSGLCDWLSVKGDVSV